jgi:S1-C subfamily serine protease
MSYYDPRFDSPPPVPRGVPDYGRYPRRSPAVGWLIVFAMVIIGVLIGAFVYRNVFDRARPTLEPRAITARGDFADNEKHTIELFRENRESVVHITTLRQAMDFRTRSVLDVPAGTGSGFVWDKSGHIVTNFHVVQNARGASVRLWDNTTYDAELVGVAPNYDLAILRIGAPASDLRPIPVGTSADLQVGQNVYAIGNPFGLDQTLTTGVLSAIGRTINAVTGRPIEDVIQTDAAVNPGNSGGPLLDSAGRLIGVNTAIYSPSGASAGIGFAVPVDTVNRIVPQLLTEGQVTRPFLGIRVSDGVSRQIARQLGTEGLVVMFVEPNSPAARAGLRALEQTPQGSLVPGDVIQSINGKAIGSTDELFAQLERRKAGDVVKLKVFRNGETREVEVTLESPRE